MSLLAPFVMLGLLAIIASHPVIGLFLMILITVWPFLKWTGRLWPEGFILAKGVNASHVLRNLPVRRGEEDYGARMWQRRGGRFRDGG